MKILIIYATYTGGTQEASMIIKNHLEKNKHTIKYQIASEVNVKDINKYDLVIVCTPTWDYNGQDGMPHEDIVKTFNKSTFNFEKAKFAIMGLGDSSYPKFCGSVDYLEKIILKNKGQLIRPLLKIDGFFYNHDKATQVINDWIKQINKSI